MSLENKYDALLRRPGEALDPIRHNIDELILRSKANPRIYSAIWQQNPRTLGGNVINVDWFNMISPHQVPSTGVLRTCRGWDLAYSERETKASDPDYSVGVKLMLFRKNKEFFLVLLDVIRMMKKWPVVKRKIISTAKEDGRTTVLAIESNGPQKGLFDEIKDHKTIKNDRIKVRPSNPVKDKLARAWSWIDLAESGNFLVVEAPWNKAFFDEIEMFPDGRYDDQADGVSIAYEFLKDRMRFNSIQSKRVKGLYG